MGFGVSFFGAFATISASIVYRSPWATLTEYLTFGQDALSSLSYLWVEVFLDFVCIHFGGAETLFHMYYVFFSKLRNPRCVTRRTLRTSLII